MADLLSHLHQLSAMAPQICSKALWQVLLVRVALVSPHHRKTCLSKALPVTCPKAHQASTQHLALPSMLLSEDTVSLDLASTVRQHPVI